jgi:hypothetical protein
LSAFVEDVRTRQFEDDFSAMVFKLKLLFEMVEKKEATKLAA